MEPYFHPTKEQVREYLQRRQVAHSPPPDIEEIRRQLGFRMLEAQRARSPR